LNNDNGIKKFIELLFVYDQKITFLNIILSPKLIEEFKKEQTLSLTNVYHYENIPGDFRIVFEPRIKETFQKKVFVEPDQIKGYFSIIHRTGPRKGWYTIILEFPD
jgi:hypothetical protein